MASSVYMDSIMKATDKRVSDAKFMFIDIKVDLVHGKDIMFFGKDMFLKHIYIVFNLIFNAYLLVYMGYYLK